MKVDRQPFAGPWLTSKEAAAYVGCSTMASWYDWRRRHAIVGNGRMWAKADLDRALKAPRRRRRMADASLANLRRGSETKTPAA